MQQDLLDATRLQDYEAATTKPEAPAPRASAAPGILPFSYLPDEDADSVTGRAGLPLLLEAFRAYAGDVLVQQHLRLKQRARGLSEAELVEAFLLLQASGGEHLEDFAILREDEGLARLVGHALPSPDAARDFLLRFHDPKLLTAACEAAKQQDEKSFVPVESPPLAALGQVFAELTRRMADPKLGTVATLDHDATVIESHKQTATTHYKHGRGFQPVAVVWAEQNLIVGDEFRDGNVPAGKDNLRLIQRVFQTLPDWVTERNFRADSACYEERVLKWLADALRLGGPAGPIGFTISADLTTELRARCLAVREAGATDAAPEAPRWQLLDDLRADEFVEWSEVEFTPGNWPKHAVPLRYLVVRIQKRQGGLFASGDRYKFLAVVTNRLGVGADLLHWHWQKAGTIEHVHDETKNGLGAGVLPCAEFGANAAWYRLVLLTYNVLTVLKREVLPPEAQRAKAKRVRFLVFNLAGKIAFHARKLYVRVKQAALARLVVPLARAAFRQCRAAALAGATA